VTGVSMRPAAVLRPAIVTIALLIVGIVLAHALGGLAFLGVMLWAIILAGVAIGLFLIVRAGRPLAGAGAIVMAITVWVAFYITPQAWLLWTILFFVGVALIVRGTVEDTLRRDAWPLLLPRVILGWALVDNAQDHFWTAWLPAGGGFLQSATGAVNRQPLYFLDPLYQEFLRGVVVPNPGVWASLVMCGELAFGLMLAMGLFTPIGAFGAMWLNGNYMLMKGFVAHSAYTDKTFFAVELFCLIVAAGLAYGLDATLRRHAPNLVAQMLMGLPRKEPERLPVGRAEPQPT